MRWIKRNVLLGFPHLEPIYYSLFQNTKFTKN